MSLVSHCAKRFQTNKSNFTIDHILNVAGETQNFKNELSQEPADKKFEWLSCTRYRPPKLPRQGKKEGVQRRKLGRNPRIPFSSSQVAFLEAKFHRTPYLSSSDVTNLASQLKLSETRVKIWFQNRRARERREKESKSKPEAISSQNNQKLESIQQPTAIFPFDFPKYFPFDYSDSFKFMAYAESLNCLHVVAPMDLSDRQVTRQERLEMIQGRQKNLAKVCPQCYKLVNSSANRLVYDTCGHLKCRICLLQETTGCLLCISELKSSEEKQNTENDKNSEPHKRKSVITSLAIQIAEQKQKEEPKSIPSVDKDTCHVIKQSLEKDILFPTDIVRRSTGNFYHLKRIFSQRFFNEDSNKKHKACETEEKWSVRPDDGDKVEDENCEKKTWKIPSHVQVQYFCEVHKVSIQEKNEVVKHHMTCSPDKKKGDIITHQCKICEKSYKEISKLNRHLKTHTKNSRFKCKNCGKPCTDNYALKTHERTHTKQKPYSCKDCNKKFSALQNYKRHEKKHKNEKKFVCNECGFKFLTKTELKRHNVTHTNIKPFTCSICTSKFGFKRTLVRHLRTHDSNLLRIKCSQCESTFKRKDNLERHIKTAHVEVKTEKTENSKAETW